MELWRYLRNARNKLVFKEYGSNVKIAPDVQIRRPEYVCIGTHVTIQNGTAIYIHPEDKIPNRCLLRIEDHVHIGMGSVISAVNQVVIEDYVLCGPNVIIIDNTHQYEDIDTPIMLQDYTKGGRVHIERECWIGAHAFIFPNVTIGRHSVIGANAVVNQDIPPFSVAVGVPARVIRRYDFDKKRWITVKNSS